MKNSTKKLSLILATLILASSMATAASAAGYSFSSRPFGSSKKNTTEKTAISDEEEEKETKSDKKNIFVSNSPLVPASSKGNVSDSSTIFVANENYKPEYPKDLKTIFYNSKCTLKGAKYYTREEIAEKIEEYFKENSYEIYMTEGQERNFCDGAYFVSSNTDVAYYDYNTKTIVAVDDGTAEFYVYTNGGIPFFKLNVHVSTDIRKAERPTLDIVPDAWRLDIGDEIGFTVTASDGKVYDDIVIKIDKGEDKAFLTRASFKLTAEKKGAVIVRAYSDSHPNVTGSALIYIGEFEYPICDGYWKKGTDCITVSKWDTAWDKNYFDKVCGWIESAEGILIPVIRVADVEVKDGDTTKKTTAISAGSVSYADILREAYESKEGLAELLKKYNFYRYGIIDVSDTENKDFAKNVDPRFLFLLGLYSDIIG